MPWKTILRPVLFLLLSAAAAATTLQNLNLEQLAAAAEVVAHVRCLGNQSRWEGGEIWTITEFEILESWKGVAPRLITVRLLGGRVGHLVSTVSGVPRFEPGEEAVVFLERTPAGDFSVTSWAQGTFRIRGDSTTGQSRVTQDSASVAVFVPATREFRARGLRNVPLETFRRQVAAAVERAEKKRQP